MKFDTWITRSLGIHYPILVGGECAGHPSAAMIDIGQAACFTNAIEPVGDIIAAIVKEAEISHRHWQES